MKRCVICEKTKSLDEFHRLAKSLDGRQPRCKECVAAYMRDYHQRNREEIMEKVRRWKQTNVERSREAEKRASARWRVKRPEAIQAHNAVRHAIRRGDLVRLPCEECDAEKTEAHHDDYSKPLEVRWLCKRHHAVLARY